MLVSLKRYREHDEDEEIDYSDYKKPRTLPFRSSPTTQFTIPSFSNRARSIPRPQILTPVESSEDESDCDLISPKEQAKPSLHNLYIQDVDNDVDMDLSERLDQPMWSPTAPESAFTQSFPSSAKSIMALSIPLSRSVNTQAPRIPTPIYGHFSAPNYPTDGTPASPAMPPPTSYGNNTTYSRARSSIDNASSDAFLRRRALPSPISEDEHMELSPYITTKTMLGNLKMTTSPSMQPISVQTLTPDTPSTMRSWSGSDSSPRNRRRSDAISGETGKVMFSMGFRADCDKCRERVPGHYSHVIRA